MPKGEPSLRGIIYFYTGTCITSIVAFFGASLIKRGVTKLAAGPDLVRMSFYCAYLSILLGETLWVRKNLALPSLYDSVMSMIGSSMYGTLCELIAICIPPALLSLFYIRLVAGWERERV